MGGAPSCDHVILVHWRAQCCFTGAHCPADPLRSNRAGTLDLLESSDPSSTYSLPTGSLERRHSLGPLDMEEPATRL